MDSASLDHRNYTRVARAIDYLCANAADQPALDAAARHVGLSAHHFQRLFTRWAGVSPKRFVQHLTVVAAKQRLAQTRNNLDLADAVGLSGGGRLHDLFVNIEAMSPGEARANGAGLRVRWGLHDTPFGRALIAATDRGICTLQFVDAIRAATAALHAEWPHARFERDQHATTALCRRVFAPLEAARNAPLSILVKGTNFQVQVWRALLALPAGAVTTYGDLGKALCMPRAARAVGAAVGANRIGYLIPCHRVIQNAGVVGGYRWGATRKSVMLGWEAARADAPAMLKRAQNVAHPEATS